MFRAFHTLKGSAGVVELPAMGLMLHAAEDVLAAIHAGQLAADAGDRSTRRLACLDQVSRWVDDFEAHATLPVDAGEEARAMAERLRALSSRELGKPAAGVGWRGRRKPGPARCRMGLAI